MNRFAPDALSPNGSNHNRRSSSDSNPRDAVCASLQRHFSHSHVLRQSMSSIKNPENEAEIPAPMPKTLQGQGGRSHDDDPAGKQCGTEGGSKPKMAPQPSAPPGLEQDNRGNAIP